VCPLAIFIASPARHKEHKLDTHNSSAQGLPGNKIALLIDFDNVILGVEDPGFDVELVVNALRTRGIVVMGRAYGDWYRHHRHRRKLMEQGIELVETPVFGPLIKNSADIRIVLDGFEIAMSQSHIDTFCLVSGDSDFLPLIKKLQYLGKTVIVIAGAKFTSDLVRRNCNEYIAYENLFAESLGATEDVSVIEGAYVLLARAINTLNERSMDVRSSTVKQMMLQLNPAFSERTFGCNQFKGFLDRATRAGVVKLDERDGHSGEYSVFLTAEGEIAANGAAPSPTSGATSNGTSNGSLLGGTMPTPAVVAETSAKPTRGRRFSGRDRKREDIFAKDGDEAAPVIAPSASPSASPIDAETEETLPSVEAISSLAQRTNLRRGRLRFSAKTGRTEATEITPTASPLGEDINQATPVDEANDLVQTPGEVLPGETPSGEMPSGEMPSEELLAQAIADEPALESTGETPARKRRSRGGRRKSAKSGDSETADSDPANDTTTTNEVVTDDAADNAADNEAASAKATTAEIARESTSKAQPVKAAAKPRGRAPRKAKSTSADAENAPADAASAKAQKAQKAQTSSVVAEIADAPDADVESSTDAPKKRPTRGRRGGARRGAKDSATPETESA